MHWTYFQKLQISKVIWHAIVGFGASGSVPNHLLQPQDRLKQMTKPLILH